jgi:bifunctional DNA-binding transcriptional regulator/antitoxin component of YhaV-PrlF toxin-antitoxin module
MNVQSKLTAQAQVSVPVAVRRSLGIGPGSAIEWELDGNQAIVRRAGRHSSLDIHQALFGVRSPQKKTASELKAGIATYMKDRYARP